MKNAIETCSIETYIEKLTNQPQALLFEETLATVDAHYTFTETAFDNGSQRNEAGQNSGSCKVFSFAKLHQLTEQQTLNMFAQFYHDDVLGNPDGDDHQNIRQFMQQGFDGLRFDSEALTLNKQP